MQTGFTWLNPGANNTFLWKSSWSNSKSG